MPFFGKFFRAVRRSLRVNAVGLCAFHDAVCSWWSTFNTSDGVSHQGISSMALRAWTKISGVLRPYREPIKISQTPNPKLVRAAEALEAKQQKESRQQQEVMGEEPTGVVSRVTVNLVYSTIHSYFAHMEYVAGCVQYLVFCGWRPPPQSWFSEPNENRSQETSRILFFTTSSSLRQTKRTKKSEAK